MPSTGRALLFWIVDLISPEIANQSLLLSMETGANELPIKRRWERHRNLQDLRCQEDWA